MFACIKDRRNSRPGGGLFGIALLCSMAAVACSGTSDERSEEAKDAPLKPPVVTDERTDLIFSWYADGGPVTATSVADVPAEARARVRVQDPSIPPDRRDPSWVFIAVLTAPDSQGKYPVHAERRADFEQRRRARVSASRAARQQASSPPATESLPDHRPGAAVARPSVVMYATRHCPVCKKARRWLLDQSIPYVEKDIERDKAAAAELMKKGRAQGVSTNGVPVFDVRGKLVPGFEPSIILNLIGPKRPPPEQVI